MRANSKTAQLQKAVNYAMSLKIDELWEDIQTQIAQQLIAAMLYTLEVSEDYEPQDMRRVFDELSSTFDDMRGVGFVPEFDGDDLMQRCKERYGIDLEAEVKVGSMRIRGDDMRLIDGDILLEQFRTLRDNWDTKNATHRAIRGAFVDCILRIQDAPTVDAEPVKHGRWIIHREEIFEPNRSECYMSRPLPTECSVCGFEEMRASRFAFCPNCGAKMDLKDGENNA